MGFVCELDSVFSFVYRAELDRGLTEHEFDHVLFGRFTGEPDANPDEVSAWRWTPLDEVSADVAAFPGDYTAWFRIVLPLVAARRLFAPTGAIPFGESDLTLDQLDSVVGGLHRPLIDDYSSL
jgi:hypothetical protein